MPRHDPINAITMGAIARDAGLTPQQFRELLSKPGHGEAVIHRVYPLIGQR